MMKSKIVVLYAGVYKVENEQTRQVSEGLSCSYLYGDSLESILHPDGTMGQRPARGNLRPDAISKFPCAPGLYEGSFEMAIDSKGKPTLKLVDVDFVGLLELTPVKAGPAPKSAS